MATTATTATAAATGPAAVPLTTSTYMIRQAGIKKLSQTHKQAIAICQLQEKVETLEQDAESHGTMPVTTDIDNQIQITRDNIAKAKHARNQGIKSMADLQRLENILAPLYQKAEDGESPKDEFAVSLLHQHRINAWKFLSVTRKNTSPAEKTWRDAYVGVIDSVKANLEVTEERTLEVIASTMGVVKASWSTDELFDVAASMRVELQEAQAKIASQVEKIEEVKSLAGRYKTERNKATEDIKGLKKTIRDLEAQAADVSMADASWEEQVTDLQNALQISQDSLQASEDENDTLRQTNEALEDANEARRTMAESLNKRNAHLERVIQQGEQSIQSEKAELAKDAAEYTSSTIKGLSAAFGEQFLNCYNEVQETKERNTALKNTNRTLEDQLEAERSALARSLQAEALLRGSLEESMMECQALKTTQRDSISTINKRDQKIERFEESLGRSQEQFEQTWNTLQDTVVERDNMKEEAKLADSQYKQLTDKFTDLTRIYQNVSSLEGLFKALATCVDNVLKDGTDNSQQEWDPSTISQRIVTALARIPVLEQQAARSQDVTHDLIRQSLVEMEKAARDSAQVDLLEPQLREAKDNAAKYLEDAATYRVKSDGLEKDYMRSENALKVISTKLEDAEKRFAAIGEQKDALTKTNIKLEAKIDSLTKQFAAADTQSHDLTQRFNSLVGEKAKLEKAIHAARAERSEEFSNIQLSLTTRETELRDARTRYNLLQDQYSGLEKNRNEQTALVEKVRKQYGDYKVDTWTRYEQLSRKYKKLSDEHVLAQAQIASLQGQGPQVEAKRQELAQIEARLDAERDRLFTERGNLASENESIAAQRLTVRERENTVTRLEAEHYTQEGRLQEREAMIKSRVQELNEKQQTLDNERATLGLERNKLKTEAADAKSHLQSLTSNIERLERELQEERQRYRVSEEQRRTQEVAKEGVESRLARTENDLSRAKISIDARDADAKTHLIDILRLKDEKAKLEKSLVQAEAAALRTLSEATDQMRREATSNTSQQTQRNQQLYKDLVAEKNIVADLKEKISGYVLQDHEHYKSQANLRIRIARLETVVEKYENDEVRNSNSYKAAQSTFESKVRTLQDNLSDEKQKHQVTGQNLEHQLKRIEDLDAKIILPVHNVHRTALPIVEAMLHLIRLSKLDDLFSLEALLMAVWSDPVYLRSDDRDLCECRLIEVILRGAHYHDRFWAKLRAIITRWEAVTPPSKSMIVRAYNRWVHGIADSLNNRYPHVSTLPDCISELAAGYKLAEVRGKIHGVETEERLAAKDTSARRTLLAGELFPSIRAYFLYDLTKQEAMMFRNEGSHYSYETRTLTLPELFGYHRVSGVMVNQGYTIETGGTFEVPRPVVLPVGLFAARCMPDIMDDASM